MADEDPVAKARAIAAKLGGLLPGLGGPPAGGGGGGDGPALGKRKSRWGDNDGGDSRPAPGGSGGGSGGFGNVGASAYGPGAMGGAMGGAVGAAMSMNPDLIMWVPDSMVGLIIGRGGENIKRLSQSTGVNVQIEKQGEMHEGSMQRKVMLKGPPDAQQRCKGDILEMVHDRERNGEGGRGGGGGGGGPAPRGGRHGPGVRHGRHQAGLLPAPGAGHTGQSNAEKPVRQLHSQTR
mmetsp:Transcript_40548/g.69909  ORF Transcript_40548/g.69909 Transcript_40548/m.69909 type:complete len:235 (+) Transcript_40548:83-787(+)